MQATPGAAPPNGAVCAAGIGTVSIVLVGGANYGPCMDAKTEELRAAHDALAEFYADRLADALDRMPVDRAALGLFCDLVLAADLGTGIGDIGCGSGRLEPYLAARGLSPQGAGLSPEMIRVARRDNPGFGFEVLMCVSCLSGMPRWPVSSAGTR